MRIGKWMAPLAGVLLLAACDQSPAPQAVSSTVVAPPGMPEPVSRWLNAQDQRILTELQQQARLLLANVQQLLAEPDAAHLDAARHSFLELYRHFHESRSAIQCRNLQAPALRAVIARLDPLPILPGFVDGLADWPDSGLVNDETLPLTQESLLNEQGAGLAEETSLGLQVIGFLLDGDPAAPHTPAHFNSDLQPPQSTGYATTERRRSYLLLATQQWVHDLDSLRDVGASFASGRDCPLAALRLAVDQQLKLITLSNLDDVQDAYFPARYRALALEGGKQGLATFLAGNNPWHEWMKQQADAAFMAALDHWQNISDDSDAGPWQTLNESLNQL